MTRQNREPASEKKNGHKPQTAPVVEPVNEFAGVAEIPNALLGLDGGIGNIQSQATTLNDPRLHSVQRQTMATQIGQLHGNQHLQRVLQSKIHVSKTHGSELNGTLQEAEATEYTELEGIGVGGSLSFVGDNPPPNVNGNNAQGFAPLIQREDDEDDGDRPSEEERARALALAKAAEQVAGQKKSEGHADTAKAKDEGDVQADAAKTAKGQAQQISTEANSIKEKRHATVKAHQDAHAAALNAALKGATAEVEGEDAANGAEVEKKAPASPQEDPAFQAVVTRTKKTATRQRHHAPAITKSAEAQAAAVPPANDLTSKAQANQVGAMDQAPTPAFNAQAFKAQLMERIAAMAPKTTEEADEFKQKDKLGSIKGEMQGKVSQEKTTSQSSLQDKTKAPPDPSGIEPKQVTELPPPDTGAAPGSVAAQDAAPKSKTHSEVEKPFQEGSQSLDKQMADEDVTEEQLSKSNEPEFQGALASKKEAQTQAAAAPQEYRSYEGEQVNQAKGQAVGTAQGHLQSMHGERAQALTQIAAQQTGAKSQDEAARAKVASDIQKIYDRTKTKVETILARLDTDVATAFDAGSQAANKTFEDYVAAKMDAYKEDRYGGWFGWARWLKDKVKGMPSVVNEFYAAGRDLFLREMDAVITNVAEIIARGLNEAKAEVANGKKEIETYVAQLPTDLKEVGDKAASDIQDKFDSLESKIDAKQNELIEQLAVKYNEKLKAIDARIEELKAANQGLIDKAKNFVAGVIRTIKKLKDMIINVLSRIADVVMGIIKDPIGFLGNLIDGIKSGLDNFISNLPKHLLNALLGWLTGELGPMGIQLPDDIFSLDGIFSLVMQILGLTWDAIRAKAVKLLGEPVVKALETGFEIFQVLINEGPIGLWKYVKDMFGNIKEMVIDAIMDMIQTEVIQAGIKWILGLLTPAGAFIKAAMAIYDIVKFFIDKASEIADLIDAIIDSIAAIASGGISSAAKLIENALAKTLPVVIGFLASLLGISDVSKKVQGIIEKIRAKVDKAINWILMKAKAGAGKVMGKLGLADKDEKKEEKQQGIAPLEKEDPKVSAESIPAGLSPADVKKHVLDIAQSRIVASHANSIEDVHGILQSVMTANRDKGLKSLSIRVDDESSMSVLIEASASEPVGRRIAWSDIFVPSTANPSMEIDDLRKALSKASMASYAAIAVDGQQIGSLSESGGGTHAEERLVRGPSWSDAIKLAGEGVRQNGSSKVTLIINRTPCAVCSGWLKEAIKDAKTLLGTAAKHVTFVLAATGTYRRQAGMKKEDKDALKAGAQKMAKRLGRPFDEVFAEQEEIWKEDLRSFSTEWTDDDDDEQFSGLSDLAAAGWQITGIDFGTPPTPRQLEIAQVAARLAQKFKWNSH